jgi:hypothetical protein
MNGHVDRFAVTAGALVGECFPAVLGWYCHPDSHFLRAFCTKQCQRVAMDHLVRQTVLQRHDDFPSSKPTLAIRLGPMAERRLYKIAHLQSFAIRALLALWDRMKCLGAAVLMRSLREQSE